jgi:dihydrofolate synthase/folylpolyglutamate synthase
LAVCTNVIDPLVSVVTAVGLEHVDYLGSSLEGIAREKAGIAKAGRPFVIGETDGALAAVLEQTALGAGARPIRVDADASYDGDLGLRGAFQRRNAAVAAVVLSALPEALRPSTAKRDEGFAAVRLPGRIDRRGKWLFDVAHNPMGLAVLIEALREMALPHPVHAVVGILGDKDWGVMLRQLAPVVDRLWLTTPPSAPEGRRWRLEEARTAAPEATVEPDFDRALSMAEAEGATVLVTGSFHTVGDAMARLPGFAPFG